MATAAAVLQKPVSETNLRGMTADARPDRSLSEAMKDIPVGRLRTEKVTRVYQDLAAGA